MMPINDVIRLAGHANHYLAVFDKATGSALDLFRTRRIASPAQRIMLIARDGGCTKPCCTVGAYGSQVHHAVCATGLDDGNTNVDELALACGAGQPPRRQGWRLDHHHQRPRRVEWIPPPHSTPAKPASTTTTAPNSSYAHQTSRPATSERGP